MTEVILAFYLIYFEYANSIAAPLQALLILAVAARADVLFSALAQWRLSVQMFGD